ncbi:MAG: HAD-IA family hydrolase [Oscillospiraceae bacterium]|nr:HAD-IA family hydrolase [Oscillospiraceae bacterium]
MFQAVVFDLDGTLLDTLQDLADAANDALRKAGLPTHPTAAFRRYVGNGIDKLIERVLPPPLRQDAFLKKRLTEDFNAYYAAHKEDHTRSYPGMGPLLAKVRDAGIKTGVVSNKPAAYVPVITGQYFPGLIDISIGLPDGAPPKPDPAGLQHALKALGASASCTLYVGDSDVDVETAHRVPGVLCCGALWGFRGREELAAAGADFLAADAAELETLIFR